MKNFLGHIIIEGRSQFSIFSSVAKKVELILFKPGVLDTPARTVELIPTGSGVFSVLLEDSFENWLYGFKIDSGNLLLDPYIKEIGRKFSWAKDSFSPPLGKVTSDQSYDWEGIKPPRTPISKTVIYEAHARGISMLHPNVPETHRGTFLGLAHPAILEHLVKLGVTAVELLPVFYHLDERFLFERGASNYWGYNPISHFSLHPRFNAASEERSIRDQFRDMVKEYHRAGIEIYLDVVFNHTGEWDSTGPTVCYRGIDNQTYYRTEKNNPAHLIDWTGCGNTFNTDRLRTRELICNALRYWVSEMGVDGFRFDLTSALARNESGHFDPEHPFLNDIKTDPLFKDIKLIAEPWDATMEGYRVGGFSKPWSEWNDRYRDSMRRFWRGDWGMVGEFATRFAGSSDLYQRSERNPSASINFITAHDGFTLHDLVSYAQKHNDENGHGGSDGTNQNYSFNCGVEGETAIEEVLELRKRQMKNLIATLCLSNGVPMLLAGDEFCRTQRGNNNAYCCDVQWNYISWENETTLVEFVKQLLILRQESRLSDDSFYTQEELSWHKLDGAELTSGDWNAIQALQIYAKKFFNDEGLLLIANPTSEPVTFKSPLGLSEICKRIFITTEEDFKPSEGEIIEFPVMLESFTLLAIRVKPRPSC